MSPYTKAWIGICTATVLSYTGAQYRGYAPGTCTDQRALNRQAAQQSPCSPAQSTSSLRGRHYYGGK